jgi:hypothetical protein
MRKYFICIIISNPFVIKFISIIFLISMPHFPKKIAGFNLEVQHLSERPPQAFDN